MLCCLIAYSGGLDSTVALHLFSHVKSMRVRAIHIHHGLHPHADQWAAHCLHQAQTLDVPCDVVRVEVNPHSGEGLEAAARKARYEALASYLSPHEILITAHHQHDQAETFLLHALRGSGPRGLAGMPIFKNYANTSWHWRPFLDISRHVLEDYANAQGLTWINDESNFDTNFDRNYLRHNIMPLLTKRWPKAMDNFYRAAKLQAAISDELDSQLFPTWQKAQQHVDALDAPLSIKKHYVIFPLNVLSSLTPALRNWCLKRWLEKKTHALVSEKTLLEIQKTFLHSQKDKQPSLALGDFVIRRFMNALWLLPKTDRHRWKSVIVKGLTSWTVHTRQGGERFHPCDRIHSQSLKKLFQEWNIPPWEREQIPLIYAGEELVAVGDLAVAKGWENVLIECF